VHNSVQSFSCKINCTEVKSTAAKLHRSPDETNRAWCQSPSDEKTPTRDQNPDSEELWLQISAFHRQLIHWREKLRAISIRLSAV